MRLNKGWLPVHREDLDNYFMDTGAQAVGIYYWLLLNACYESRDVWISGKKQTLKAGDILVTVREICKRWKLHHHTLRKIIAKLEERGLVSRINAEPIVLRLNTYEQMVDMKRVPARVHIDTVNYKNYTWGSHNHPYSNNENKNNIDNKNKEQHTSLSPAKLGDVHAGEKEESVPFEDEENTPPEAPKPKRERYPTKKLLETWNDHCGDLPKAEKLSDKRRTKARALLKKNADMDYWKAVVVRIANSSFCRGHGGRGWIANFDFFLRSDTHIKAMEGLYDDKKPVGKPMQVAKGNRTQISANTAGNCIITP